VFDSIKLILLGVGGLVTVLLVLLAALARLRDELVNLQIVSERSFIGRQSVRSQRRQVQRVLSDIGFRHDHLIEIRAALDSVAARVKYGSPPERLRPDRELLLALKQWTKALEPGFKNPGNISYYVDTMGAMDYSEDESLLARIAHQWVIYLEQRRLIAPPDCFLVCKEGNIVLARQVCKIMSSSGHIKPIVCKGEKDHSRVRRTTESSHWTDFEGLAAFLQTNRDRTSREQKFRVVALDDNCTTGSMQCGSIRRFNEFVYANGLPFHPVQHAVTLFVVRPDSDNGGAATQRTFGQASVQLHAMLGLGENEMKRIISSKERDLVEGAHLFKKGFGCESANTLD
jgi:hypothetical protein